MGSGSSSCFEWERQLLFIDFWRLAQYFFLSFWLEFKGHLFWVISSIFFMNGNFVITTLLLMAVVRVIINIVYIINKACKSCIIYINLLRSYIMGYLPIFVWYTNLTTKILNLLLWIILNIIRLSYPQGLSTATIPIEISHGM